MSTALLVALGTFAVSAFVVHVLKVLARRRSLFDLPNERSAHAAPTPRLGGVGMTAAALGTGVLLQSSLPVAGMRVVLVATALISVLGLLDDLRPLPARYRLAVQLLAASVVVAARMEVIGDIAATVAIPKLLLAPVAILGIVWLTNLFNFMDGIDGLAGVQAITCSLALAAVAANLQLPGLALTLLGFAAAAAGFLIFNFPPATIFMGDAGSTALGFFFGCVPLLGDGVRITPAAVWVALGLFVCDATWTLARRISRGERWAAPHRTHWYQRPLAFGATHRAVTLRAAAGMTVLALSSYAYSPSTSPLLLAPLFVFGGFALWVRRMEFVARSRRGADPAPH